MFKKIALTWALRRPSPDTISLSMPKCADNDFYSTEIEVPSKSIQLLVKEQSVFGFSGFLWIERKNGVEACITKQTMTNEEWKLSIKHYYKGFEFDYESPFKFCFATVFQFHRFAYSKDKLAQALFNNKKLVRLDRIKVLEYFLERTSKDKDFVANPFYLGSELYTHRWFLHPDREQIRNHYRLVIDSLEETGDLERKDTLYKLAPKALDTISNYERDEQKHLDSQNNASKTRNLTKAIILLGMINIIFQIIKWKYP